MRIFLLITFIIHSCILYGSNSFKNYSVSEGLLHKTVYCITMDSDGFIWVGTSNGLSRFDGNSFYNFTHNTTNKHSLHGTSIHKIKEGIDGKLWISTEKGIEFFNKKTESFHEITIPEIQGINYNKNIDIDTDGTLWLYHKNSDFIGLNYSGDTILYHINKIPEIEKSGIYQFQVSKNILWIACPSGIIKYDIKQSKLTYIEKKNVLHCFATQQVNDSIITMSFLFDGIYVLNTNSESGYWISKTRIENNIKLKTYVYDASFDSNGALWIGMAPGYLIINKNDTSYYDHYSKTNYFDGGLVSCIYKDANDNMWLGTYENGIYLKKNASSYFTLSNKLYSQEIEKTEITSFCVFDNGSLLYTDNRGIYHCNNYRNLQQNTAQRIHNQATTNVFSINGVECLVKSTDSLFNYNSETKQLKKITEAMAISYACKNSDNVVWIGTWIGLIVGYNLTSNERYEFHIDSIQNSNIQIFAIEGDPDGSIWVGTVGEGLIHITNPTSKNRQFTQYNMKEKNDSNIPSNIVHCIYTDKHNKLWIGTNGDGIIILDKQTKHIQNLTTKDGLLSNIIESITADIDGNIWFSSSIITKYTIQKNTFTHYTKHDGIGTGFINKAGATSKEGILFFANSQGFLSFNPRDLPKQKRVSTPVLTHLYLKGNSVTVGDTINGKVPYTQSITYSDVLTLPYTLNSFSIQFSSIQFQESDGIMYRYRLNKNQDWIATIPGNQIASYSEIEPGTYTFEVQAKGGDGEWSKTKKLTIIITPPWWKTWWFQVVLFLTIITVITIIIFTRIHSLKKYNIKLEETVTKRTEELTQTNEILEEKQLVIKMKNDLLHDALTSKNQLISILAHDFKTPLQGIIGTATLLENENETIKNNKVKKYIEAIVTSIHSLSNQMVQVLEWIKSQDSNLQANPTEINIEDVIEDVITLENGNATQKNITILVLTDYESNAYADPQMISTVYRNVLSNAIKFTEKGSRITIIIQELDSGIETVFIDSGKGISLELIDTILNTNNTINPEFGTDNEQGSGLGLRLCMNFIRKNNGTISIKQRENKGTIFTISIPKGKTKKNIQTQRINKHIQESQKQLDNLQSHTLLVIDDNIETLDTILESFGINYEIYKATNGEDGYSKAKQIIPDIIISDVNMPKINGIELCSLLKNDSTTSHIPILIISSYSDDIIKEQAFKNGANDFIEKPFNPLYIKNKIEALLKYREKSIEQAGLNSESKVPEGHDDILFTKIIHFIDDNISNENLGADFVAEQIGVSKSQIWRLFKKKTNNSIGNFIREKKLQKAAGMLMTGKYRIGEISDFIGFSDSRYFSRIFMKEYGMSPSDYAKKFKKNV